MAVRGKQKMPARAWIYDQLTERKFSFFDEFIALYRSGDDTTKTKLLTTFAEYLFPKARPEDASGEPDDARAPMLVVTDEQLQALVKGARGEAVSLTPEQLTPERVSQK